MCELRNITELASVCDNFLIQMKITVYAKDHLSLQLPPGSYNQPCGVVEEYQL